MWNLEVLKNKIKVLNRGKNFFVLFLFDFFKISSSVQWRLIMKKKKVNSIVIKETTIFKKSSSKQVWNLKNVAVTFTDRSELPDQQHRDFLSLPRGTCRTMRAQNRAGRGHRTGEGMRGGGKKNQTQKKLMHKVEGELLFFFSRFEISDVNRKQRRQLVKIYSLQTPPWQKKRLVPVSCV